MNVIADRRKNTSYITITRARLDRRGLKGKRASPEDQGRRSASVSLETTEPFHSRRKFLLLLFFFFFFFFFERVDRFPA